MNPLLIVFFTINDLKVGKKLPIYFPKRDPSKSPPFLPKQKADQIPFAFKQLPFAIYYCYYQEGDNKVLKIELEGENGDRVEALAICHMDTSQWNPTHPSFEVLKLQPGDMPICHFFPADDFVWIPVA
ncbi:LOW QUALITY PROTEIN: BURP domain protein USPL1-like [Benincasa hispida]|uniref:LOW QUALITY PROTEIN: BURP domain protein USPL1-like n=1 Tax=Benincasa hispida TaxID=102211 RepID=UPI001900C2A4|nr:LOW QUALITY PROTEIN: BURP domain protein USPL1-like [Benincasa hispida]